MDHQIEQFLRDILLGSLPIYNIREKALELLLANKAQMRKFSFGGQEITLTDDDYQDVVNILRSGFIAGIKEIRLITDCGLKMAKDVAEEIVKNERIEKVFHH